MRSLEQMKANAQKHLDGMTANRDHMANDVIWLADTVRRLEKMIKDECVAKKNERFGSAFDSVFRGMKK